MVGPLSGSEGIAVKDYSKTQPNITFINGSSGAQATTLVNPSPNFFRFNTEGAQWMVGLGKAALDKGYKRVMVIAEDYAFPYSQVQGFMAEYCKARRQGAGQGLGAARRQGLRLGDRAHPEGRRRAGGGARRRRRGELPQPVRAGGRRQADDRRLDHGEPGHPQLQGQAPRVAASARSPAAPIADAYDGAGLEEVRRRLQEELSKDGLPEPVALRVRLLRQHEGGARRPRRGQGRPVRRPEEVPRGAARS